MPTTTVTTFKGHPHSNRECSDMARAGYVAGVGRVRWVALAAFVLLLFGAGGIAAAEVAQGQGVTVFGDSVADRMQRNPIALAALNEGFTLNLQTRGCRRLVAPSCTIVGSSGTPTSLLPLVRHLGHSIGKIAVVDIGYNDTPTH